MMATGCNLTYPLRTCGLLLLLGLHSCAPKENALNSVGAGGSSEAAGDDAAGAGPTGSAGTGTSVVVVDTGSRDGGADATGSGSDAGPPRSHCSVTPLERIAPVLMVLLDQSGSMAQTFDGASRWTRIVGALTAEDSPLRKLDQELQLGLTSFTSDGGFGQNPESPRTCPILKSVASAVSNFSSVQELLDANVPQGDSPGPESLTVVAQQLAAASNGAPASILWIIDGTDTCEDPNLQDETVTTPLSIQALSNAFQLGIRTQILTVGNDTSDTALHELASAGAGGDPNAQGFHPGSAAELATALATAVENVRSCELRLPEPLAAGSFARVRLGASELAQGADWEASNSSLRLLGSACAALKTNAQPVTLERCAAP